MGEHEIQGGEDLKSDEILRGLIRELKNPILLVARASELASNNPKAVDFEQIERSAQQALLLIDRYLMSAQSEYGQRQLSLAPASLGSVFYDVSQEIEFSAKANNYRLEVDARYNVPAMVDSVATQAILGSLSQIMMLPNEDKQPRALHLRSFKGDSGKVVAGVLSSDSGGFSQSDLDRATQLHRTGSARTVLNNGSTSSGVHLLIAQSLAEAMGGRITPIKRFKMRGLGVELIKSEQLSLV